MTGEAELPGKKFGRCVLSRSVRPDGGVLLIPPDHQCDFVDGRTPAVLCRAVRLPVGCAALTRQDISGGGCSTSSRQRGPWPRCRTRELKPTFGAPEFTGYRRPSAVAAPPGPKEAAHAGLTPTPPTAAVPALRARLQLRQRARLIEIILLDACAGKPDGTTAGDPGERPRSTGA